MRERGAPCGWSAQQWGIGTSSGEPGMGGERSQRAGCLDRAFPAAFSQVTIRPYTPSGHRAELTEDTCTVGCPCICLWTTVGEGGDKWGILWKSAG